MNYVKRLLLWCWLSVPLEIPTNLITKYAGKLLFTFHKDQCHTALRQIILSSVTISCMGFKSRI